MENVTRVLERSAGGDASATAELLPLVYDELRRLAAARMSSERADHTLQSTALVHEAYLRLVHPSHCKQWACRGHFFAAAAEAMRRILIESARAGKCLKRGGDLSKQQLSEHIPLPEESIDDLLDIDAGLERLQEVDEVAASLVKLRLFASMSVTEAGATLNLSRTTAYANWNFARAWIEANMLSTPGTLGNPILSGLSHEDSA